MIDNLNLLISLLRASSVSADFRMMAMTSSRFCSAILNPSRICSLSCAFFRSYSLRRLITSIRCSMNTRMACLSVNTLGSLLTKASTLILNVVCRGVRLYNSRRTDSASAALFSSMTMRIPCLSDSSRKSEIPSRRPSRVNSAIRSIKADLLVIYGSSVIMMRLFPRDISSRFSLPLSVILPFPVAYAERISSCSCSCRIIPPVGKSGPLISFIKSVIVMSSIFFQ